MINSNIGVLGRGSWTTIRLWGLSRAWAWNGIRHADDAFWA
jgi:hypothetical protein